MILGFKEQFKQPVLDGKKIHTIREDKGNRWNISYVIDFATGVRTKKYNLFHKSMCTGTQSIKIVYGNIPPCGSVVEVIVDGRVLFYDEVRKLAKNDGVDSVSDFLDWFDKDFEGKIIH